MKFSPKSSSLSLEAKQTLKNLSTELLSQVDVKLYVRVYVFEKDDNLASLKLSNERAAAIKAYLISLGINTDRIVTLGLGMSDPIVPIDDPKANALNERVDLKINY